MLVVNDGGVAAELSIHGRLMGSLRKGRTRYPSSTISQPHTVSRPAGHDKGGEWLSLGGTPRVSEDNAGDCDVSMGLS